MSDNVKTVEQFLETARLETGDVWMDNHDWRHLIAIVDQLAADLAAAKKERDAAKADAQRLAVVLQRMWDHEHLHPQEYLDKHPDDRIYGDWYRVAVGIHKDAAAALAEHQRGE